MPEMKKTELVAALVGAFDIVLGGNIELERGVNRRRVRLSRGNRAIAAETGLSTRISTPSTGCPAPYAARSA